MQIKLFAQDTNKKIQLVKIIRSLSGLGLRDSKAIADIALGSYVWSNDDAYAPSARTQGKDVTFTVREGLTREDVLREFTNADVKFVWEFVEASVSLDAAKLALELRSTGTPVTFAQDVADAFRDIMPDASDLLNEALEVLR